MFRQWRPLAGRSVLLRMRERFFPASQPHLFYRHHPPAAFCDSSASEPASFRLVAHLVTAGIVFLAVLVAQVGPGLVYGRVSGAAQQAAGNPVDFLPQRTLTQQGEPFAAAEAAPETRELDAQLVPAYTESHTVEEGETLAQIADQYHISVASVFWANDLAAESVFAAGQEIRIPRMDGVPYLINEGDTLAAIAAHFQVPTQAITLFKANGIQADTLLPVGQESTASARRSPTPSC